MGRRQGTRGEEASQGAEADAPSRAAGAQDAAPGACHAAGATGGEVTAVDGAVHRDLQRRQGGEQRRLPDHSFLGADGSCAPDRRGPRQALAGVGHPRPRDQDGARDQPRPHSHRPGVGRPLPHARARDAARGPPRDSLLLNHKKHGWTDHRIDDCSSAPWFTGFTEPVPRTLDPPFTRAPQTWLARKGWKVHGLISLNDAPLPYPRRS
jgi:hypothetical protein